MGKNGHYAQVQNGTATSNGSAATAHRPAAAAAAADTVTPKRKSKRARLSTPMSGPDDSIAAPVPTIPSATRESSVVVSAGPVLLQDSACLQRLGLTAECADSVLMRVRRPLASLLNNRSLPPRSQHLSQARTYLKRAFHMLTPATGIVFKAGADPSDAEMLAFRATLQMSDRQFVVFATESIRILPNREAKEDVSFSLLLKYPSAACGRLALQYLKAEPAALPAGHSPFLFTAAPWREHFICGIVRGVRLAFGAAERLQEMLSSSGASHVRLRAVMREHAFSGEVEFAVPVSRASELTWLKSVMGASVIFKKRVRPTAQVCSNCWDKGHSASRCPNALACKHCKSTEHIGSACGAVSSASPCLLCGDKGHCITSCAQFRPQLVAMEIAASKKNYIAIDDAEVLAPLLPPAVLSSGPQVHPARAETVRAASAISASYSCAAQPKPKPKSSRALSFAAPLAQPAARRNEIAVVRPQQLPIPDVGALVATLRQSLDEQREQIAALTKQVRALTAALAAFAPPNPLCAVLAAPSENAAGDAAMSQ
jgi:hypothetical protein